MTARGVLRRTGRDLGRLVALFPFLVTTLAFGQVSPYPPSRLITNVVWHWDTRQTAALGSDLWPVTWGPDDNLYLAWGDGGGFGGSDSDGRVSLGFARVEGGPENFRGFNINGGKNPEHPASYPKRGKGSGVIFDRGVLYACINQQDGKWPNVSHVMACSTNNGATWTNCDWVFPPRTGAFQPGRFLNFGRDGAGAPAAVEGYLYLYGGKFESPTNEGDAIYLARVPGGKLFERDAYEFCRCPNAPPYDANWIHEFGMATPVFQDTNGCGPGGIVYDPGLKRYLLSSYHSGPGQLGVFESPNPWGPWFTVAYETDWGGMGAEGEGLSCEFPQKWMSADGTTLWAIFSVYGAGGKQGIVAHDRFNLIKVTLLTK